MDQHLFPSLVSMAYSDPEEFWIDEKLTEEISQMAEERGLDENDLVNELLLIGMSPEAKASVLQAQIMLLTRDIIRILIETINDEDNNPTEAGRNFGNDTSAPLLTPHTKAQWYEIIDKFSADYDKVFKWLKVKHTVGYDKKTHRLIITHKMDGKWTHFLKGYVTGMISTTLNIEPKININGKTLEFTLE